jgi:Protein of unknown function (DUF3551)
MRAIGLISITLATIVLTTTDVRGAGNRWCAIYTQRNCTFATFEQCRAQVLGLGGWCQPNPFPDTAFGAHAKRPRPAAARAASRDLPSAPGRLRMADQIHAPKPTPSGSARLNTASA